MVALQIAVRRGDRLAELPRSPDGAKRVVLMPLGDAEDRHRSVANELFHRAAVPPDHRLHGVEVTPHHRPQRFGIQTRA